MILDCFSFFNEIKLLLIRLHYLDPYVDHFIILESRYTYSGLPKPLLLDQYWEAIPAQISKKIIRCQFELNAEDGDPKKAWVRETGQRSILVEAAKQHFPDPRTISIVSDLDEIPHHEILVTLRRAGIPTAVRLQQTCLVYNPDTRSGDWCSAIAAPLGALSPQNVNAIRTNNTLGTREIDDAGWHFTFVMSPEKILHKIQAYAHQEFNRPHWANLDNIKQAISNRVDLFDRYPGKVFESYSRDNYPSELRRLLDLYMPQGSLDT